MKLISATKRSFVFSPSRYRRDNDENNKSFIFDVEIVPLKPTPHKIEFVKKHGKYTHVFSMTWRKFLRQPTVGNVVIIEKYLCEYRRKL